MLSALKSEFRKLLTVRSTYFVTALVFALVVFIGGYINGWMLSKDVLFLPTLLESDVVNAIVPMMMFGAIVAILLMTHEYRYNTIMYTLTASNSRINVLLAKFLAVSAYALFLTVLVGVVSPAASYIGIHAHGHTLVPQTWHWGTLVWHTLFYGWAYSVAGLLLAVLVRSQVGAIAALFLIPGVVEQLLTLVLKHNAIYLPFTVLQSVLGGSDKISDVKGALVFVAYLVVGWIVATILFLKRDAN
jgi:ABC-type transport system involved in multi-copper enzyme maturation permease subunit